MGLADRQYGPPSNGGWRESGGGTGTWPPVTKWLILINIAVFVLQIISEQVTFALWLDSALILKGQVWRLLTCAFCHAPDRIFHILINMLFLGWLGRPLEQRYGSREFLALYLTAALVASLTYIGLNMVLGRTNPMLGASGAVAAVLVIYALIHPRQTVYLMMIFPIEFRWLVVIYFVYDLYPVLQMLGGKGIQTGTAHAAHLGGLGLGYFYYKRKWRLEPLVNLVSKPPAQQAKRAQVKQQKAEVKKDKEEQRVDDILDKVSKQGLNSLSEKERKLLRQASKDLRGDR